MPEYVLSVWHDDDYLVDFTTPDGRRLVRQVSALNAELRKRRLGVRRRPAAGLVSHRGPSSPRRGVDDRRPLRRDQGTGGRVWVIHAADLDAALDWAGKAAVASERPVELRPLQGE